MSNKNILARDLTLQEKEAIHDKNAKHILQNKEILSRLLKETSDHFSEMSLEEIQESLGRETELVVKLSEENHLPSHGTVYLDGVCTVSDQKNRKVFVETEPHIYTSHDEESLFKEGVYKLSRMIVTQGDIVFSVKRRRYDQLKSVIAFWIVFRAKKCDRGKIRTFRIFDKNQAGNLPWPQDCDMMELVIITAARVSELSQEDSDLMKVISTVFSEEIDSEEKIERLKKLGVRVTDELEEELEVRSGLQEWFDEKYQEGLEAGRNEVQSGLQEWFDEKYQEGKAEGEVRGELHLGNAVTEAVNLIQKGYRSVDVLKMIAAKYELSDNARSVLQSVVSLGS